MIRQRVVLGYHKKTEQCGWLAVMRVTGLSVQNPKMSTVDGYRGFHKGNPPQVRPAEGLRIDARLRA